MRNWLSGWEKVETEFHIPKVGRVDIALLYPNHSVTMEEEIIDPPPLEWKEIDYPQEILAQETLATLRAFVEDPKVSELKFPRKLSGYNRKIIHELAGKLGLSHQSEGFVQRLKKINL